MEALTSALFGVFLVPIALLAAAPLFIYVYVILRWRAGSAEEPGMGSYSLVLMFRLFSVLLGLASISLLLYAAISSEDHESMTRVCWPVLVASLVFLAVQFVLGSVLDPEGRFAAARRLFGGGLVAISGVVTLVVLVALLVTLWEEVTPNRDEKAHDEQLKAFGCWLVCFGAVYLASAVRMARGAVAR